ncbi:MAG: Lrp/AsnC family transcriptional regulator [Thaumarchaeota archaeon]|nr:Lrp/AsnC family transcriptional regulator [Candidatus Terraquivivens yellowstonensis]MCL7395555.1 Lrp/AsnC family transcriptional regulator [Candidatus Terraquivivens yellowstonensis]MCL7399377.1 Lrp/AsnC family transcriptional regulator [Candidatus Terraquivivens yellowstonensis]
MVRISDLTLIKLLMENARTSYVEIAKKLGVSEAAVRKRIKRLEDLGVIKKYTVEVDPKRLGYEVLAIIGLDAEPEHLLKVMEELRNKEETVRLYLTSGDHMLVAECWFKSSQELSSFIKDLESREGVRRVCPAIVLESVKRPNVLENDQKSMLSFKDSILKTIEEYNKYRSPEAKAKLVKISDKELVLDFEGSFCRTCGVFDYFEDFIYELQKLIDVKMKVESFKEHGYERFRVKYVIEE